MAQATTAATPLKEADWAAVHEKMEPFGGEELRAELTAEDEAAIEAMGGQEDVATVVAEVVEE